MNPAVDIMNFLVANRVCATIFATGVMSQTPQGAQVMAIIRAHPELFEIANHTMYHCDLVRGGGGSPSTAPCAGGPPSADRVRKELTDAAAMFANVLDRIPPADWDRTVIYNYPKPWERSLRWVAVHTVHEVRHHTLDVRRQLGG